MKEIKLTHGYVALIDDDDYERVSKFTWHVEKTKTTFYGTRSLRVSEQINGVKSKIRLHVFIMGQKDGLEVDHVDNNGLNCQKHNLRHCTHIENSQNVSKRKNGNSKYKGVVAHKNCTTFSSKLWYNKKQIHIGSYKTEIEAAIAYDQRAKELFGEFCYLNFPDIVDDKNHPDYIKYITNIEAKEKKMPTIEELENQILILQKRIDIIRNNQ